MNVVVFESFGVLRFEVGGVQCDRVEGPIKICKKLMRKMEI